MKKKSYFTLLAVTAISLLLTISVSTFAFNYNITFTGTGASSTVESVIVQNLTKGTTVTVPTGNTLNLYDVVSSIDQPSINDDAIHIYPNPIQYKSNLTFFCPQAGNTQINVFGVDGRNITGLYSNLQEGKNQFQLSLAPGAYILKVNGNGYNYASRVISQSNSTKLPTISFIGNEKPTNAQPQKAKNGGAVTSMLYSVGDQLLYKGTSGNYTTIVTDKPTEIKTTNFYFVECKDADDNYYPVVIIGSQIWMAENLKTTSYRTGEGVSNVTDASSWLAARLGAWCNYNNKDDNGIKYGHLYNFHAVADVRYIAPVGWHIASDSEFTTLTTFLGGESVAGGKLKQAGTVNWTIPNTGATNETGFSALPGGYCFNGGTFDYIGNHGAWWSSTSESSTTWCRGMGFDYSGMRQGAYPKEVGLSVRCLRDITIVIPPTLSTTNTATLITGLTASSGGNITTDNGAVVTARGVCWNTTSSPTIELTTKTSDGNGSGAFTSVITGLTPNTTYYVRSYATNSIGTSYGTEVSFQTATKPTVTTTVASNIASTTVTCGGNVTSDGKATVTIRGVCWSTTSSPTIALTTKTSDGTGPGIFTSLLSGLTALTTYYVRSYATNSIGTSYGTEVTFQTVTTPTLTTTEASTVACTTAKSGGNISNDGKATVTARGVCWSTSPSPTIYDNRTSDGTGIGSFISSLTVLFSSTTYYVRAYATNNAGTGYGNEQTFTTTKATDIEGNQYSSVKIGTQTWMGENLKTTKYRTGESISKPTTATNWMNATYGAWCDYNSDAANGTKYGHLYNWYAVADARNIAPVGWHVATDADWTLLTDYLGGEAGAGGKLKETGTTNWITPNLDATNSSNFTALPGGIRSSVDGAYNSININGTWWTNSQIDLNIALSRSLTFDANTASNSTNSKVMGYSIRCVRDEWSTLNTTAATSIAGTSATTGGNIISDGGADITARGVCWNTRPSPTIALTTKTSDGAGSGLYISSLTGLTSLTTYYVRSYATNSIGTSYGTEVTFTTSFHVIGASYLGGKIAYLDASGIHGFVCALEDQSTGIQWYNGSYFNTWAIWWELEITGVYGISKSGGRKNTDAIIAAQGVGAYAASICAALTIGDATAGDWYLPSKGELNQMYINKDVLGGFTTWNYWSSTEYGRSNVWIQSFLTGAQAYDWNFKNSRDYVRAIRAF